MRDQHQVLPYSSGDWRYSCRREGQSGEARRRPAAHGWLGDDRVGEGRQA